MKYLIHYTTIISLLAFLVLPVIVMAETPTPSPTPTITPSVSQYDSSGTTSTQQQMIRQWRYSSEFSQQIAALGTVPVATFPIPVLFGVGTKDIWPNFGDPRPHRLHEGEDIMAVKGTPIVSPTDAVVTLTNYDVGAGNSVYTANPGGESFVYYHLDRIGEGVTRGKVLHRGSLIGYVGNTGDAAGGPAHLHFEVHNSAGTPTDPFPRLAGEFPTGEKISYLSTILTQTSDPVALSQFLVTNFRSTFILAQTSNIILPSLIIDAMAAIPAVPAPVNSGILPPGDLDVGSSGTAVINLQKYLIQAASGAAATRLAAAGATGYFGLITKAALIEYQIKMGISPATGYYGPVTRAFITAHPLGNLPSPTSVGSATIVRNLYLGIIGEDVRTLQKLLNTHGYIVATTGPGSPGNETTIFGNATKAAVIKFQIGQGITPAAGYVGPITRAALASL